MTTSRFSASGFSDEPWTLRFHSPQAMQAPFASPDEPRMRCTPHRGPVDIPRPRTFSTMASDEIASALRPRSPPIQSKRRLPRQPMPAHSKVSDVFEISRVRTEALYAHENAVGLARLNSPIALTEALGSAAFSRRGAHIYPPDRGRCIPQLLDPAVQPSRPIQAGARAFRLALPAACAEGKRGCAAWASLKARASTLHHLVLRRAAPAHARGSRFCYACSSPIARSCAQPMA